MGLRSGEYGWREQEPCSDVFQDCGVLGAAVGGEVVQNDDITLVQGRGQLGFDIEVEEFPVDWPADDPGRIQAIMAQAGNEGLGLPVAEGGMTDQTRPAGYPSGGPILLGTEPAHARGLLPEGAG